MLAAELFDAAAEADLLLIAAEVGSSFWAFTCIAAAKLEVESLRGRVIIFISSMCFFLACSASFFFRESFLTEPRLPLLKGVDSGSLSATANVDFSLDGVVDEDPFSFDNVDEDGFSFTSEVEDFSFATGVDDAIEPLLVSSSIIFLSF